MNNEKLEQPEVEPLPRDITGWRWALASTAILASCFLYALDITVVAAIQPIIVAEYDAVDQLAWLSVAVLLSSTATNMVWGRLYTQFNSKWLYLFNVFLFEVGSAICGAAPNMEVMIAGRAICGVSGAGLYVGVMSLIAVTTTIAERPLYISGTGVTWGLGIVLGPVVGGAFSESAVGWRWSFYINLFIGAVFAPAWLFLLPSNDPRPGVSYKQRIAEMDYAGTVLSMGALTTFILAINWGGATYPWVSGRVIGLFVTSSVLFVLLGIQQVTILILFGTTASSGAAAFIPIYFVPLFFQFTRNDGAFDAGARLLPLIVLMIAAILYTMGGLLTVAGGALMYPVDQDTSHARIYGYTILIGVGVGMYLQTSFSVTQAVVDPENVPPAVGFITVAQFLGITVALAIANTVLPNMSREEIQAAIEGAAGGFVQALSPDLRTQVVGAIVAAIGKTYVLVIAAGSLVTVLSLVMKREKLFMTAGVVAA
ncbi:major facilitator superfamily domain-containing protein [Massariosphaeria phaeospora]|uniref:Major facilitator superfamily domain-containing protein n=1 Tax=Massariosphaeria phaeospora TaxID=100035 RepID=A0A7C8IEY5_9PLEO|nr:major facilitator superfamily domain-containing protein [Massariosphaeria phaeospora]